MLIHTGLIESNAVFTVSLDLIKRGIRFFAERLEGILPHCTVGSTNAAEQRNIVCFTDTQFVQILHQLLQGKIDLFLIQRHGVGSV